LLLIYPKLKIVGKGLSVINKEIYHLESGLIAKNSNFKIYISGVFSTGLIIHFDPRYLESFSLFFLSTILHLSLPPSFLQNK